MGRGASQLLLSPGGPAPTLKPGFHRRGTVCLALGQRRWWWWYLVESTEIQDLVTMGKPFHLQVWGQHHLIGLFHQLEGDHRGRVALNRSMYDRGEC